jgi:hypothetical protein
MANPNDKVNYTDPKTGKVVSSGQYIPDDNPDVVARHNKSKKAKSFTEKVADLVPFKTKKFKKALEEEKKIKPKLSTAKTMEERKINRKAKKMTASEGSFAKGGKVKLALKGGGRAYNKNS